MRAVGMILAGGNSYRMKELSNKRGDCGDADRGKLPKH